MTLLIAVCFETSDLVAASFVKIVTWLTSTNFAEEKQDVCNVTEYLILSLHRIIIRAG